MDPDPDLGSPDAPFDQQYLGLDERNHNHLLSPSHDSEYPSDTSHLTPVFVALDPLSSRVDDATGSLASDATNGTFHSSSDRSRAATLMASTAGRPPVRLNGEITITNRSALLEDRSANRSSTRSASTPARARPPGTPSVKDLKKRFDRNDSPPSVSRVPIRSTKSPTFSHANIHSAVRHDRDRPTLRDSRSSQDMPSTQSFASRVHGPRRLASDNHLKPDKTISTRTRASSHQKTSLASNAISHGLLFGEILPEQRDIPMVGYGIERIHPRQVSASSEDGFTRSRSFSDPDIEIASSTAWYRGNNEEHTTDDSRSSTPRRPHGRSRSDAASSTHTSPTVNTNREAIMKAPSSLSASSNNVSKLPLSVRMLNTPTVLESSSSITNVSSSRLPQPQNHYDSPVVSPATARAKTPTSRAKTPTRQIKDRKLPPPNLKALGSNSTLQAYVAVPPPKLSPTLRSSRPRQAVASASTTSTRLKERGKSSAQDKPQADVSRRRKISIGPIDFEQRREHIRLAYSKSIRESQALGAHAAATPKAGYGDHLSATNVSGEISLVESHSQHDARTSAIHQEAQRQGLDNQSSTPSELRRGDATTIDEALFEFERGRSSDRATVPLTISISPADQSSTTTQSLVDSPTLGIPGSFPPSTPPFSTDNEPLSAVSATSETTEFDNEPQTQPPTQASRAISDASSTSINLPSLADSQHSYQQAETQFPPVSEGTFRDSLLSLDDFHDEQTSGNNNEKEVVTTGSLGDDFEERFIRPPPTLEVYQTKITILPPSEVGLLNTGIDNTTVPIPRLSMNDEPDEYSEGEDDPLGSHNMQVDRDVATEACTEELVKGGKAKAPISASLSRNYSSRRSSTCASSVGDSYLESALPVANRDVAGSAHVGLEVPFRTRGDRLSQQSAWTDFTVESTDESHTTSTADLNYTTSVSLQEGGFPSTHVPGPGEPTSFYQSQDSLPLDTGLSDVALIQQPTSINARHTLPELDTGEGFSVQYLETAQRHDASHLPSPTHQPPPVPLSTPGSAIHSRTSSVFYDQSQYDSTLVNSELGSQVYNSLHETPQHLEAVTLERQDSEVNGSVTTDAEGKTLSTLVDDTQPNANGKERQRLVQRRNVIKELVDTEAIFVRDMNIVEEIYKGTAEACPKLDDQTVKLVFRNSHEIIEFHTVFLAEMKEAVAGIYIPKGGRSAKSKHAMAAIEPLQSAADEPNDTRDREALLGSVFQRNVGRMKAVHESFLRNSDQAAKRLIQIQQDPTVKLWLTECNEVAKDLTAAWDLDSLLIKPMQRITKYPNLIITLLQYTPDDHPDREELLKSKDVLESAIIDINKTKKNFELVGQIVGRKRKESESKTGFARAFGKRVDKLQASSTRPTEDADYAKLNEKFGDDYLRLQVVLRDVEFYTRQVSDYVHEFLQYLSSIELVMRIQPGNYPELESKWVQFNISMRDIEKVALDEHLSQVRRLVIEPFEHVIKAYGNPSLAMKKREKRRQDYERGEQLKRSNKSIDSKLRESVEQYEALNEALKTELPKLSALTEKVGNICLGNFVNIQVNWFKIWKEKLKTVLSDSTDMPDLSDIVTTFQRDYPYAAEQVASIGILDPAYRGRISQSTATSGDDGATSRHTRSRTTGAERRGRGSSVNGEGTPILPTPDFLRRTSGSFTTSVYSPATGTAGGPAPSPHQYHYRDFYAGIQSFAASPSPRSAEIPGSSKSAAGTGHTSTRPSTGRSYDSTGIPRQSSESAAMQRKDSNTTYSSNTIQHENSRFSNLFHSALPPSDGVGGSQRSSRASSRERGAATDGYNVLWLAASLFEFNISTTKHEAGYPYLTYQAGEIFDVIAEKGELWLAKNQDDESQQVGWIWSKHFARLADS